MSQTPRAIPGTTPFDGTMARKGYALNKMCFSFNDKANRDAFLADAEAYMRRYALTDEQMAGIFGLDMQDIGAQQTGMTKDEFKAKLVAANEQ